MNKLHAAPRGCPVCGQRLVLTRLGCAACGTEVSGSFESCEFCSLTGDDRELLLIFLRSRGNMKDLERHLGVSYPTARARFDSMLGKLGIQPAGQSRVDVLEQLARGEIDLEEADRRLG